MHNLCESSAPCDLIIAFHTFVLKLLHLNFFSLMRDRSVGVLNSSGASSVSCCGAKGGGTNQTGVFILRRNHGRTFCSHVEKPTFDSGAVCWKRGTGGSAYFSLECLCTGPRLGKGEWWQWVSCLEFECKSPRNALK